MRCAFFFPFLSFFYGGGRRGVGLARDGCLVRSLGLVTQLGWRSRSAVVWSIASKAIVNNSASG